MIESPQPGSDPFSGPGLGKGGVVHARPSGEEWRKRLSPERRESSNVTQPLQSPRLCPLFDARITRFADLEPLSGRLAASKSKVALRTLSFHNRNRPTKWFTCLAVLCFVCVLLSTTVQATHFCGLRGLETQTAVELDRTTSASPVCLTCLMAPSMSAVILLVAFFAMASSIAVCRRPADAPETRPEFFPAVYSPSSASPGLGRFPICNFPFFW